MKRAKKRTRNYLVVNSFPSHFLACALMYARPLCVQVCVCVCERCGKLKCLANICFAKKLRILSVTHTMPMPMPMPSPAQSTLAAHQHVSESEPLTLGNLRTTLTAPRLPPTLPSYLLYLLWLSHSIGKLTCPKLSADHKDASHFADFYWIKNKLN